MHINELLSSPLKETEIADILKLTEIKQLHFSQSSLTSKKSEKFKLCAIICILLVGQALYLRGGSAIAHVFNLNFGIMAGFILTFYSAFQCYALKKSSLNSSKLAIETMLDTEEKYGVVLISKDRVVVRSDKHSYFIKLPSFEVYYREENKLQPCCKKGI
jgi:hypothetical protein